MLKIIRIKYSIFLLFYSFLFFSCEEKRNEDKLEPKPSLVTSHKIEVNQILYQFYEQYGFTDVCIHSRTYFKVKEFSPNSEWKKLPINKEGYLKLNLIPNKIDTLKGSSFSVIYNYKDVFSDISLSSFEYIEDSTFKQTVSLLNGYYRINKGVFEVFNSNENTIYFEEHNCGF